MIINANCLDFLETLNKKSIDMIFADPPYFLSNGGLSIRNGNIVSVNKGSWDTLPSNISIDDFNYSWIFKCDKVLKDGGAFFICGTMHNIFSIKKTLESFNYKIVNIIIWHKTNPPPLIYKNKFRFSYEFVIWASKGKSKYFNYKKMYNYDNKEMEDVWFIPAVGKEEKEFGYHPTQKPELLLTRIVECSTKEYDTILDPFMGSGTSGVIAKRLNRNYIGIEKEKSYYDYANKRITSTKKNCIK